MGNDLRVMQEILALHRQLTEFQDIAAQHFARLQMTSAALHSLLKGLRGVLTPDQTAALHTAMKAGLADHFDSVTTGAGAKPEEGAALTAAFFLSALGPPKA